MNRDTDFWKQKRDIGRELMVVERELAHLDKYDSSTYQRLMRKKKRILRRMAGKDIRWTMGIDHGGKVPPEKLHEYKLRKCFLALKQLTECEDE